MQLILLQRSGRIDSEEFKKALESTVSSLTGRLSASATLSGFSRRGWAKLNIVGPDSEIVTEMISREFGTAEINLHRVEMHGIYEGLVNRSTQTHLEIDIGVETPEPTNARIDLPTLRAQLTDGRPLPMKAIVEDYCLFPESKLAIRVTHVNPKEGVIEAWLADSETERFSMWMATRLDRVLVFGCLRHDLELKLSKLHLDRDIISLEPITLTITSLLCKLGTDAIGLIPRLGSALRKAELKPFLPRRILSECRPW
jgi:hypothetical protein